LAVQKKAAIHQMKVRSGLDCLKLALSRRAYAYIMKARDPSILPLYVAPLNDLVGQEMAIVGAYESSFLMVCSMVCWPTECPNSEIRWR
jgi:hypothetical protein